jgi:DNA-binding HxlR family transcriptional regulator
MTIGNLPEEGDTMANALLRVGDRENGARRIGRRNAGPRPEDLEMIERTRAARDLLASKWKVDLLYLLARGAQRYSRLYDNLRGASKKMLTDSLRGLERDGFVERSVYAEVPVRVEYSLTTLGWAATELLMTLAEWADEHFADVEQARLRYRQTAAPHAIGQADLDGLQAA